MNNYKKVFSTLSILFVFTLIFTACSKENKLESTSNNTTEKANYKITLYYPTEDYIVNGNEENKFESLRDIVFDSTDEIFEVLIDDLKEAPKDTDNGKYYPAIPKKIQVNSIKVEDSTAYVDFNSENLSGGSLDENILINTLFFTLTSLTENEKPLVDGVLFTVDGEEVQSLMGHFDVSKRIESEI
ncbi:GerMN domain-containing protein [Anaerosphaera multitolerans]|uniref:GerMN domain-containing protein n=1 Tax=Anaerosphaera multitolerans TaxID=2487351 RepID=A0A437S7F4_9FIRM|nr:GerMN domain-containing protein [Anaerosphaera multitolerans]RVU55000.1 hypothetical protein EF514_05295 [Anaerosphaera multitolerans]